MRPHIRTLIEIAAETLGLTGPVFEFGAYQVAGQERLANLRPLFPGCQYVGCDMRPGLGVDRVEDLAALSLPSAVARTVLCLETLEHTFDVHRAAAEIVRMLAPGAIVLISVPFDFRLHAYPDDYWRLTPSCLARLLAPLDATLIGSQGVESHPHTVFGIGCKAPVSGRVRRGLSALVERYDAWLVAERQSAGLRMRAKRTLVGWSRSKGERRRWREEYVARWTLNVPANSASNRARPSATQAA